MNRQEFATLAEALSKAYKKHDFMTEVEEQELWYRMLKDLPYKALMLAVQKWIATEKWSPSIAELRELATEYMNAPVPGCEEAWERVLKIARGYSPYDPDGTQREINALDDVTRECLKLVDIRSIAYTDTIGVERAHFMKMYESVAERRKSQNQMPEAVRRAIEAMQPKPMQIETQEPQRVMIEALPEDREQTDFDDELKARFL